MTPNKIKLIPVTTIKVEIAGVPVFGDFRIVDEWEGFIKLKSENPVNTIIVEKPAPPKNAWDFVHPIFGGGSQTKGKLDFVETEIVKSTV